MKVQIIILIAFIVIAFAITRNLSLNDADASVGEVFYVSPLIGNNANNGTSPTTPFKTVGANMWRMGPGDTMYFMNGEYFEDITINTSGTAGNPQTFKAYPGHTPIIRGDQVRTTDGQGFYISNKDYIVIDGIQIRDIRGHFISMDSSSYITIKNCHFENGTVNRIGVQMEGSDHVTIQNCFISEASDPAITQETDLILLNFTHYSLIENNTLRKGTHTTVSLQDAHHNIIRNNDTWNVWQKNFSIAGPRSNYYGYNVFENNRIFGARGATKVGETQKGGMGIYVNQEANIIRKNTFYDNERMGVFLDGNNGLGNGNVNYNKIYSNTLYKNGLRADQAEAGALVVTNYGNGMNMSGNVFKNNIVSENKHWGGYIRSSSTGFHNNFFEGNCFYQPAAPNNMFNINGIGINTLSWYQSNHSTYVNRNYEGDPLFNAPGATLTADFTLKAGSPCIDRGVALTTTRSAGSGNIIPVNDAGYFSDGFGIAQGDLIILGTDVTNPYRITSIDYTANNITIDKSATWTANMSVNIPYSGNAPDSGAYESGLSNPDIGNGGAVCGNGTKETGEVCDDGNSFNEDQCSNTCLNSCTAPNIWNGSSCVNPTAQTPFGGSVRTLPGTVQAEDFDVGGQSVSYNELSASNLGGSTYRTEPVDVRDAGSEKAVGYFQEGEWLEYTLNNTSTSLYTLTISGITNSTPRSFRFDWNGALLGRITVPYDPATTWQTFQTATLGNISIPQGQGVLRITLEGGDTGDINWFSFTTETSPTAVCGNNIKETGEACDDGNTVNGDQCSSNCLNVCTSPQVWNGTACATPVTQTPFGGTVRNLPGRIQGEDFDEGGQDVSYNETTTTNLGGSTYRTGPVDVRDVGTTERAIGYFANAEWLEYTLNNTSSSPYKLRVSGITNATLRSFKFEWNGTLLGSVPVPYDSATTWQTFQTTEIDNISIPQGQGILRITLQGGDTGDLNWFEFISTQTQTQTPFGGSVRSIPGTLQAEDFDEGGQDISYNETTSTNLGGSTYRTGSVDVRNVGNEKAVGYFANGEWLEYTLNSTLTSPYNIRITGISSTAGRSFRFDWNGTLLTTINAPLDASTDWQSFLTTTVNGISIPSGEGVLRITLQGGSDADLEKIEFLNPNSNSNGINWTQYRSSTFEAGNFTEWDQTNASEGTLNVVSGTSVPSGNFEGTKLVEATQNGSGNSTVGHFSRTIWNLPDWGEGTIYKTEASFYIPSSLFDNMQGAVQIIGWDSTPDPNNHMRLIIYHSDKKARLFMNEGGTTRDITGTFTIPAGQWVTFIIEQKLHQTDGWSKVYMNGNLVAEGSKTVCPSGATRCGDTMGGFPLRRIRYGLVAIADTTQLKPLTLYFDKITLWTGAEGSTTLPESCNADYDSSTTVDLSDFQTFAANYKKTGISCSLDIVGGDCYLDIRDFQSFATIYKIPNACTP